MRRGFGLIGLLATVILLVIVGAIAYNIGYGEGVSTHLPAVATNGDGTAVPGYYYGHPFGVGFGLFGIFWFLLILFGLFWLFRLAFFGFWGRRMMGGGWGYGGGRGWGPGPGKPRGVRPGGPGRPPPQPRRNPPPNQTPPPTPAD